MFVMLCVSVRVVDTANKEGLINDDADYFCIDGTVDDRGMFPQ